MREREKIGGGRKRTNIETEKSGQDGGVRERRKEGLTNYE